MCSFLLPFSKTECAVLCMHSLFKLLSHSPVFKDVFREVGILEVLTSLVQNFVDAVKEKKGFKLELIFKKPIVFE